MAQHITGLHHVTATVGEAQADVDFYVKLLGLRLVKRTVNFDNAGVYHFYYGDGRGTPGTIMTTFPYAGQGVRVGQRGAGQVTVVAFSAPAGSLGFWRERLSRHGVDVRDGGRRFGEEVLAFADPSGLVLELVAGEDRRAPWLGAGIDGAHALRGVHSVTLAVRDVGPTRALLEEVLGLAPVGEDGGRLRFGAGEGDAGQVLDVLPAPGAPTGVNGIGTVHHVALAIGTEAEQRALQAELRGRGFNVTDVRDRNYFRSIYFREPGGVLLEVATEGPGFLIDEAEPALGRQLMLPDWEEPRRAAIEAALPGIEV